MSRTIRKTKYGEIYTDKDVKPEQGCWCFYCTGHDKADIYAIQKKGSEKEIKVEIDMRYGDSAFNYELEWDKYFKSMEPQPTLEEELNWLQYNKAA